MEENIFKKILLFLFNFLLVEEIIYDTSHFYFSKTLIKLLSTIRNQGEEGVQVVTTKLGYCFYFLETTCRSLISADVSHKARKNHFSHRVHHFIRN